MQNDWRTAVTFSNNLHGRTTVIFSKNIRTNYILPNIIITIKPPTNEPGCRSGNTLCSNSMSELPNARSKSSSNFSAQKLRGARTAGTFQYRRSFSNNLRRAQDLHTPLFISISPCRLRQDLHTAFKERQHRAYTSCLQWTNNCHEATCIRKDTRGNSTATL